MSRTVLITGFGPYPGAPFNPTAPLVRSLARIKRGDVHLIAHVFPTTYAAVDRDLPALLKRHKPDALVMFGLAPGARAIRIETRARNVVASTPDAGGNARRHRQIERERHFAQTLAVPGPRLVAALRRRFFPARLSYDAGRYLCNYIAWRAATAARAKHGPRLAAFIHIPLVRRDGRPKPHGRRGFDQRSLERAGMTILMEMIAAAGRH